jgi:hypothetical protein
MTAHMRDVKQRWSEMVRIVGDLGELEADETDVLN